MKKIFAILLMAGIFSPSVFAQLASAKSGFLSIDLSGSARGSGGTFAVVTWTRPSEEISSTRESSIHLRAIVNSRLYLDSCKLVITSPNGTSTVCLPTRIDAGIPEHLYLDRVIKLSNGMNTIDLVIKSLSGRIVLSSRDIFVSQIKKTKQTSETQRLTSDVPQLPGTTDDKPEQQFWKTNDPLQLSGTADDKPELQFRKPNDPPPSYKGSVSIVDGVFTSESSGTLKRNVVTGLRLLIRNDGKHAAMNGTLSVELPPNILAVNAQALKLVNLDPGATKEFEFDFDVTNRYNGNDIPIKVVLADDSGTATSARVFTAHLDQSLISMTSIFEKPKENEVIPVTKSLRSAVDINIPQNPVQHPNHYALVIGNEDYSQYQPGLMPSQNVIFARNDAIAFRDYLVTSFGFPERQVFLVTNATREQMNSEVDRLCQLAKLNPESEIVLYYAGHGVPDVNTRKAYMIPIDVKGNDYRDGVNLGELYKKLSATNASRIIIFLDACFSGGGRGENGLLASRSIHVKTNGDAIEGNLIVVSATNGEEIALPLVREGHGLFTYCVLKMMQSSGGNFNFGQLKEYLDIEVPKSSLIENGILQTPQILVSPKLQALWKAWKI